MSTHKRGFNILKNKGFYQIFIGDYDKFVKNEKRKQHFIFRFIPTGITKRWFINSFGLIFFALVIIEIVVSIIIKNLFYSSIQQSINSRSNELANILQGYNDRQTDKLISSARKYVETFPDKKYMQLTVFDHLDRFIITSTAVESMETDVEQSKIECENAKSSSTKSSSWVGKLSSGEKVITVTRALYSSSSTDPTIKIYLGSIRYSVSLEKADSSIFWSILVAIFIGIAVLLFVLVSSLYFIKSIIVPIRDINLTTKKIAQGDFKTKINKKYDDEIGELCDAINYMADELNTSEQMKNDFISSISHELRTPLTAIKGWAETMHMDLTSDPEMIDKGMNVIISESERLCGLVEELLDFSRMQSGRMVLVMERIDVLAELTEAVYIFKDRARIEEKHLLYTEPKIISPIIGDKNRLRQVFINIIDNALKYTEKSDTIEIKVAEIEKEVRISISDTGCGIAKEDLPKVKVKFYKANQTQRGSGIGLAVADEIITMHHGTLEVSSEENIGTTVEIRLPIVDIVDEEK